MSFLRSPFAPGLPPSLRGRQVVLRTPEMNDHEAWVRVRMESREFLTPWEPLWPSNEMTRAAFRGRIKQYLRDIADDHAYPFFIFTADERLLLGALTLSNLRRGVAQSATLGYWIGVAHARKGHMTDAVRTLFPFAFDHLGLHRIEAGCIPGNAASIALLRRTGFHEEGLARSYLKINGEWRDHLLFARLWAGPAV